MTDNHKFWKGIKHFFMKWYWRVGQIGALTNMFLLVLTYTTLLSDKIQWRFGNPYLSYIVTFAVIAIPIGIGAYLYDARLKFWVEQTEVVVERNPYMMYHMTAKEVVSNLLQWIPMFEKMGNKESIRVLEDWVKESIIVAPRVKPLADQIIRKFNAEKFVRERYPWYDI